MKRPGTKASLTELRDALRRFADARDWQQFHTPKNLAMALSVEAAELLEHFQWLTAEQCRRLNARTKTAVGEEIADVVARAYATKPAIVAKVRKMSEPR